jgi:predicted ATPase/signal transduction histidine kinase
MKAAKRGAPVILERLREDALTEMLRVEHPQAPQGRAMLKRGRPGPPNPEQAVRLRNECEIVSRFRLRCMLTLLDCGGAGPDLAMLFENAEGVLCERLGILDYDRLLALADALAEALGEIHAAGLLHRDFRPANLLAAGERVYVIDFARALVREREHPDLDIPDREIDRLRYIAPERTGRMNRPADCRADFYSLGATLYRLATGRPPFATDDPYELIYRHLAVTPPSPETLNPRVPVFFAGLVMKLLAKEPDRRYQSVEGLRADLLAARSFPAGRAAEGVVYGLGDVLHALFVSHRLYGREREREILLACFERACRGSRELLLIAGYSGIGKTSLIRETYIPATRQRAFFVAGKFDQLQRRLPYSAWIEALRKLVGFVLAEPADSLSLWRKRLGAALGRNGGVLAGVIPGLDLLLGPQAPPPELPPAEALNRFNETFRAFVSAFALPERPLAIFLDDLQWIDAASLQLLDLLARDARGGHLFLIGAYRDNEVASTHPLRLTLEALRREAACPLTEMTLPPLDLPRIGELAADTLAAEPAEVEPLALEIARKTGGNPFFLWQFLRTLRENGWIWLDGSARRWRWNLPAIRQADFADNVAELMLHRFQRLPEATRTLLSQAACLGARFDLDGLSLIADGKPAKVYADLSPALREEFLLPLTAPELLEESLAIRAFRFSHDRMQEAAYRALAPAQVAPLHRRIGRLLLAHAPEGKLGERILEIADHLNAAAELVDTPEECLELARLDLLAARKARESAAFEAALKYLETGMARLPEDLWEREHELAYALFRERGELEYLNSRFDAAESFVERAIAREADILRRAELHGMLVVQYTLRALYPKAIETARRGLALFAVALPEDDYETARDAELARIEALLRGRGLNALADLPPMQDARQRAVMTLLMNLGPPCYRSHPRLWSVIVALEIRLCLQHGATPSASYSYPAFGGLLTHVGQGGGKECAALRSATRRLMDRFGSPADISVGYLMMGSSLRHWHAPLSAASADYLEAYKTGLDSGNLQYAVYAFGHNVYCRYFQGVPLDELIGETEGYLEFSRKRRNLWGVDLMEGALRVFRMLRERADADAASPEEPESAYLARCEAHLNAQVFCIYHILKADALLHLGRTRAACASLVEAEARLDSVSVQGLLPAVQFRALKGLALADAPEAFGLDAAGARAELAELRRRCAVWAESAPENFEPLSELLRAEEARLDDDLPAALEAYDRAQDAALAQGFRQWAALAATRAAAFWRARGKADFAAVYRNKALENYRQWRADGVVAAWTEAAAPSARNLDWEMVIRTVQALSRHTSLNALAPEVIRNVARQSGAQRAVLILAQGEDLRAVIEAGPQGEFYHDATLPLEAAERLPKALIRYVARSRQAISFNRGEIDDNPLLNGDAYLQTFAAESAWCLPLIYLGSMSGVLYLEQGLAADAFRGESGQLLEFLAAQAAVSLHNARLIGELEAEAAARRGAEASLRTAYAELARFAEISAHHLREPTRQLSVFVQRLRASLGDRPIDEEAKAAMEFIERAAARMRIQVGDVERYLSMGEAQGPMQMIETVPVLEELKRRLAPRIAAAGAALEIGAPPPVRLDRPRLARLLEILLDNALIHRAEGVPPYIRVDGERLDGKRRLSVEDNGPGIPETHRQRVFEVFERLRNVPEAGAGMGLAMARRIVESRGGQIRIETSAYGGAAVVIELPDED